MEELPVQVTFHLRDGAQLGSSFVLRRADARRCAAGKPDDSIDSQSQFLNKVQVESHGIGGDLKWGR